tara:strand:- start:547 stop:1536 length:990 start_codon:yes stop_codon:yes gene_type:complete
MSRIKAVFVSLYHYSLVVLNIYLLDCIFTASTDEYISVVGLVLGIAKAGVSAYQAQQAKVAERDALIEAGKLGKQIADRKFINKFAALQAPTKGTQLMMEQVARQSQAATEASKEAGARGVIGGTGRTVQGVTEAAAKIAARLDDLQLKLDNKFLTEEQRIGLMNEKKDLQLDYQRLQGAQGAATAFGTQAAQAQAGVVSGFGEAVAGGIAASGLYGGDKEIDVDNTSGDFSKGVQKDMEKVERRMNETGTGLSLKERTKMARAEMGSLKDISEDLSLFNLENEMAEPQQVIENLNVNTPYDMSGLQGAFQLGEENIIKDPLTGLMITN